jgi:PAS domain S-box-containing protein
MQKLREFLSYIKDNRLEEAARESIRISREMNFPLMRLFADIPDEALIPQSMKSISDFADQLQDGTYHQVQEENLKKWEEDRLDGGIPKDSIQPTDLVLIYVAQKKAMHRFIPDITSDPKEIIRIVDALEQVHSESQDAAINMMFKWRKETEAALEQANRFLDTVLEHIPNMIFVKDAKELRFIRFNKAGEELLGHKKSDLIGKNDFDFFPEEQAEFFTAKDRDVLKNGRLVDIKEEPISTRNRGMRWLHTKKIPVTGDDGRPQFLLGISEDITEQKKQEEAIMQLNKELEAFSYSVSHDLRAPLRAVNGYATMLEEDYGKSMDDEGRRLLSVIRYNAEKMGRLIDDLLAFSRLGRKELDKSEEDMNQLVEGVLIELGKSFEHHAEIKVGKLDKVKVDYGLMHQVMLNLISNAVKYSSKKEKPLVEITSERKNGEVVFCVKDNGVGFDMMYVDKLFGVFQRLHAMDEFEGTGVGLAIVQRIISRHGGRVWAEAEIDKGASFFIALPAINPN